MPFIIGGKGNGGSGGVVNVPADLRFSGADLAACVAARDLFFTTNPSRKVAGTEVLLQPVGDALVMQLWDGVVYRDITAVVKGDRGEKGDSGVPLVTTVQGRQGNVVITRADLNVDNVDNTSDANKPISTATQTALDGKAPSVHNHTTANIAGLDTTLSGISTSITSLTNNKQEKLTSGTNIKSVNGNSLLGSGDIVINASVDATTTNKGVLQLAGDLAGTAASPKVAKIDGVTVSSSSISSGKVLKATSTTTASFETITAADVGAIPTSAKGVADGVATLDANGRMPSSQLPNGIVQSVNNLTGAVVLTKASIGLDLVQNTADADKPISLATQTQLNLKLNTDLLGKENGVCDLDANGKIPSSRLAAIATGETFVVANQAGRLAAAANKGDVAVQEDTNESYILRSTPASTAANWVKLLFPATVSSVNGQVGSVNLTKASFGLDLVDNTSDVNKPVSSATQTELNKKLDKSLYSAKGVLLTATAASTPSALSLGTDGQVLMVDTSTSSGVKWGLPTSVGIVDNLTTDDSTKVLSAAQGKVLKGLVDSTATNITQSGGSLMLIKTTGSDLTIPRASISADGVMSSPDKVKLDSVATNAAAVGSVVPSADGTASAGTAATAARSDHVHPETPLLVGATSALKGAKGLVPEPAIDSRNMFLKGDGNWASPAQHWAQANSYHKGDIVFAFGMWAVANDNIPANTSFVWSKVATSAAFKPLLPAGWNWFGPYNFVTNYVVNDVFTTGSYSNALFYRVTAPFTSTMNGMNADLFVAGGVGVGKVTQIGASYFFDQNNNTKMIGATATNAGAAGMVPAPTSADRVKFLKGDGTWEEITEAVAGNDSTISAAPYTHIALADGTQSGGATKIIIKAGYDSFAVGDAIQGGGIDNTYTITAFNAGTREITLNKAIISPHGDGTEYEIKSATLSARSGDTYIRASSNLTSVLFVGDKLSGSGIATGTVVTEVVQTGPSATKIVVDKPFTANLTASNPISVTPSTAKSGLFTGAEKAKLASLSTTPSVTPLNWNIANSYLANTLVKYTDNLIYMANGNISANTAWATGTSGATWRQVGSTLSGTALDLGTYKQAAKQSIPHNVATKVTGFTAVNASAAWDSANNRFAITQTGLYRVRGRVSYDGNSTGIRQAFIQKNGVTVTTAASAPVDVNTVTIHVEETMGLAVGDLIDLHTFQTSGGSLQTSVTATGHFSELEIIQLPTQTAVTPNTITATNTPTTGQVPLAISGTQVTWTNTSAIPAAVRGLTYTVTATNAVAATVKDIVLTMPIPFTPVVGQVVSGVGVTAGSKVAGWNSGTNTLSLDLGAAAGGIAANAVLTITVSDPSAGNLSAADKDVLARSPQASTAYLLADDYQSMDNLVAHINQLAPTTIYLGAKQPKTLSLSANRTINKALVITQPHLITIDSGTTERTLSVSGRFQSDGGLTLIRTNLQLSGSRSSISGALFTTAGLILSANNIIAKDCHFNLAADTFGRTNVVEFQASWCTVDTCTFFTNSNTYSSVFFIGKNNVVVDSTTIVNCRFDGSGAIKACIGEPTGHTSTWNGTKVINCQAYVPTTDGFISVYGGQSKWYWVVQGNYHEYFGKVTSSGADSVWIYGKFAHGWTVTGNNIANGPRGFINTSDSIGFNVSGNNFLGNAKDTANTVILYFKNGVRVAVTGNSFMVDTSNVNTWLSIDNTSVMTVTGNCFDYGTTSPSTITGVGCSNTCRAVMVSDNVLHNKSAATLNWLSGATSGLGDNNNGWNY